MPFSWGSKQEFKNRELVVLYNLDDSGTTFDAVVRGKSFEHAIDSYIVEFTPESKQRFYEKYSASAERFDCISITEACLKRPGE